MRILFLVSSMEGGGAERVAALLSNQWAREGHEIVLMPTFSGRGGCSYPIDDLVQMRFLADFTKTPLSRSPIGRLIALRKTIDALAPEIVLSFLTNVNVAAVLAGSKVPVVVSERVYPPLMPTSAFWRMMRRLTYSRSAAVVMQTRQGLDWLNRAIPHANGTVIANPVLVPVEGSGAKLEPSDFLSPMNKLLLSVGRLDRQKNFDLLIRAFGKIAGHSRDWRLVILGEGDERQALESSIAELNLSDRVLLPGRAANLGSWLRCANAFAMTSSFEGFPNALLEALAYGIPSFALDCPTGPRELIQNGVNGLLGPADSSASEVAEALGKLLERTEANSGKASAEIRARYGIEAISKQWILLFEQLRYARPSVG